MSIFNEMDPKHKDVGGKLNINGKIYIIYGGVNPIGRNREAVVNIKSLGVSQQHAILILVDDDLHFISDLKSSNGTFLDNKKLDPLQLYRLENGARLKFGDIEGTYFKCTPNDNGSQGTHSILSENTQNFTQNFYGSDTQIMDNTSSLKEHSETTQVKDNVSTQELAEMADKLENSYINAHEQPTQVVNLDGVHGATTLTLEKEYMNLAHENQSVDTPENAIFDIHEVETQVILPNEVINEDNQVSKNEDEVEFRSDDAGLDIHEAETQVITGEINHCLSTVENVQSEEKALPKPIVGFHDIETQAEVIIDDQEIEKVMNTDKEMHNQKNENIRNPPISNEKDSAKSSLALKSPTYQIIETTQANNIVNSEGVYNIMTNSQNSLTAIDTSIDDSDSDIRPIKKSVNIFTSQDSTYEDFKEDTEKSELISYTPKQFESTNDSDTDDIRPLKKSTNIFESQDSEGIEEGSNDSVDFMTMQKIPTTQKLLDFEELENKPTEEKEKIGENIRNTIKSHENNDSETDIEDKPDNIDDGSETENEIMITSKNKFTECEKPNKNIDSTSRTYSSSNKSQNTDSETYLEEKNSNSAEKVIIKRKKKTLRRKKRNFNIISDSDSETDNEIGNTHNFQIGATSTCSDSDIDIEKKGCMTNRKNEEKNESIGLILEESAFEEDPNNSGKQDTNEDITIKQNVNSRLSVGNDEILNDSDFIPSTQEENSKSTSQNQKFENSENSFKLGLTQLMEEDNTSQANKSSSHHNNFVSSEGENGEPSQNQLEDPSRKKFTFKKSPLGITKQADITLDYDKDIYEAKTQNICEDNSSNIDEHIFLQPTQEAPKRTKHSKDETIPDDEIYMLSTQQLDGGSSKHSIDDLYQQSTQKLIIGELDETHKEKSGSKLSDNEIYEVPTQKIPVSKDVEHIQINNRNDKNPYEEEDIFATQVMDTNNSPNKGLESELENMFATQKAPAMEDSLDRIQDIVHNKGIIDEKLPTEDGDLEAILATQKMLNSPKKSKKNEVEETNTLGKSVESQLEVIFASQTSSLPADKYVRPPNPLVDIFGQDTQDTQETLVKLPKEENTSDKSLEFESSAIKSKKSLQIGLEQSFALLEADSFKIRRSGRNKNCEEITVSCPKTRVSMIVVPHDKKSLEVETKSTMNIRNTRKRKPSVEKSRTNSKEPGKKRRISETSDTSDDKNDIKVPSGSTKQNIRNRLVTKTDETQNEENIRSSMNITERPQTPSRNKSSRIQRKITEESNACEKKNSDLNNRKSYRSRTKTNALSASDNMEDIEVVKNKGRSKRELEKPNEDCETENKSNKNITDLEYRKSSRTRISKLSNSDYKEDLAEEKESKKCIGNEDKRKPVKTNNSKKVPDYPDNPPKTPSRMSKRGSTIQVTTPPKIKKVVESTPCSSRREIDLQDTPNRMKRKLKPKVVFTMMENPQLESQIKLLGGSVVDSVDTCTVLITKFVKRTMKLLSAVGLGKPICSEAWVQQSKKENNFLDPWDFVLVDIEAEKKWNFSLKTSLERSLKTKLFEGYTFQLLVSSAQDVLKGAIESCGGKIVARTPKVSTNFVVVASPDQKERYKKILKQQSGVIVVEPEAIFDGVLRQEIRFERHLLK